MQNNLTIANGTGGQVLSEIDNAFISAVTFQSGSTYPSVTYPYMIFCNTSTNPATLMMVNSNNNGWMTIGTIDPNLGFSPSGTSALATSALTFGGQINTYYAPINSPTFTGTVTAPTVATYTNNTQIATTAFCQNLVGSISYSSYAPLASPALTGVPTCPTAANGTNNNQIASTSFVNTAVNTYNNSTIIRGSMPGGLTSPACNTPTLGLGFTASNRGSTITFNQQMQSIPSIVISPKNTNGTVIASTVTSRTANGFTVFFGTATIFNGAITTVYPIWDFIAMA